jgi:hypothetical protein
VTDLDELILDLRSHAHEAPAPCCALMRRAASELDKRRSEIERIVARLPLSGKHQRPPQRAPVGLEGRAPETPATKKATAQ